MPDVSIDGETLALAVLAYIELRLAVGRIAGAVAHLARTKQDKPKPKEVTTHV